MPTILRIGRFRFHFFSDEDFEPAHIHVKVGNQATCKFWLEPIALARNAGVRPHDVRKIERLIRKHLTLLREAYREYHGR